RPRREVLGQIHADLAGPHHRSVSSLRENVLLGNGKVTRNDAQDILNLDASRLDALDEIADDRLGDIECDGGAHQLPREVEAIEGALELASTLCQPVRQQGYHIP